MIRIETWTDRNYPAWMPRVEAAGRRYEVTNVLHPHFYRDWWSMWRGRRLYGMRYYLTHIIRRLER